MKIFDPSLKYLQCEICEASRPDGESMQDYARLSVAVTPEGHLYVACVRHDEVVAFIQNDDLSRVLLEAAGTPCRCGQSHKETLH